MESKELAVYWDVLRLIYNSLPEFDDLTDYSKERLMKTWGFWNFRFSLYNGHFKQTDVSALVHEISLQEIGIFEKSD